MVGNGFCLPVNRSTYFQMAVKIVLIYGLNSLKLIVESDFSLCLYRSPLSSFLKTLPNNKSCVNGGLDISKC